MKVQSVNNYYSRPYSAKNPMPKQNNVSFGHTGLWDQFKLGILQKSDIELEEIAKYFHKSSESELKDVATIRNFFGSKSETRSQMAYQRLKQAVKSVSDSRKSLELLANLLIEKQQRQVLSEIEKDSLMNANAKVRELDNMFESRKAKFYHPDNTISQDDIDYFKRYDNDY